MHLISFDASPRQLSKLRNGHKVRIKKGAGFNLIVHPGNYQLVSRAFAKNKGIELKLSPEELDTNKALTEEEHNELGSEVDGNLFQHLPFAEGGSIFKKGIKGGKLSLKKIGRDIQKAFKSPLAKKIGNELKPLGRVLKSTAKDLLHQKIAEAHMAGTDQYGSNPIVSGLMNVGADLAHSKVQGLGLRQDIDKARHYMGVGLGAGLYAYPQHGRGMNVHDALKIANMASAHANHQLAKMHNASVHGQITQPPIKSYWDGYLEPPSRGSGIHDHMNLIRGRGSMISQDSILPPALQSQPYGANWHMQFFLPPEYHRYNDGGSSEGRGLFL